MRMRWLPVSVLIGVVAQLLAAQWQAAPKPQSLFDVKALSVENGTIMAGVADYGSMNQGGVWVTTDNGTTWTMAFTGTSVECVLLTGSHMFAGQMVGGLQVSHDNGATWKTAETKGAGSMFVGLAFKDGVLFAASFNSGLDYAGIHRSTDLGTTWTPASVGLGSDEMLSVSSTANVLLAGAYASGAAGSGGVYRSTDLGLTWTHSSLTGVTILSFTSAGSDLFAGAENGIYRSTDNGATWQLVATEMPLVTSLTSTATAIYAGTGAGVYVSTDGGTTWSIFNDGLVDLNVRSLAMNGQTILAGMGLGLFTFTPPVIVPVPAPQNLTAVAGLQSVQLSWDRVVDARPLRYRVFAGTSAEPTTILDTVDAGSDPIVATTVSGLTAGVMMHFRVTAFDADVESPFSNEVSAVPIGFGSVTGTATVSGLGRDSVVIKLCDTLMVPFAQTMTNASGGYSFGNLKGGDYYVSLIEPAGYTTAQNPRRISVTPPEATVADFKLVLVSSDTCRHWRGYWRHQIFSWLKGIPAQESFWDLVKYILEIFKDYCARFPMFKDLANIGHWDFVFNPEKCVTIKQHAISHLGAMLMNIVSHKCDKRTVVTKDGKTYWDVATYASTLLSDTDESNDAIAMEITSAANEGRLIERGIVPSADGATGVEDQTETVLPQTSALLGNYPNPFNPATRIEFRIQKSEFTRLSVYDMLGREVAVLVNRQQEPGQYTVTFDATGLPSGLYLCRLTAGHVSDTKKMLLTK